MWLHSRSIRLVVGLCLGGAGVGAHAQPATQPAPPMATIADSSLGGDRGQGAMGGFLPPSGGSEAVFFVVKAIDGEPAPNGLDASRRRSSGLGGRMAIVPFERPVKAGKVRLRLLATVAFAAPIDAIFKQGRRFQIEGETEVDLRAGVRYRVNGVADTYRREVWIEEVEGGRIVGNKVVEAVDAQSVAAMAGADRYTCCNLRYDDRWISDSNVLTKPFVPAGARVKVLGYGRSRVNVLIEGRPVSAGADFGFEALTREQFGDSLFVKEDPTVRLAAWPPDIQAAILEGKVMRGMSREQVLMSIGRPRPDPALEARGHWVYFATAGDDFDLAFGADGTVREINANRRIKALVVREQAPP